MIKDWNPIVTSIGTPGLAARRAFDELMARSQQDRETRERLQKPAEAEVEPIPAETPPEEPQKTE